MRNKIITQIRNATVHDIPAITEIYNEAILKTTSTFDTEPKTESEQIKWFQAHGSKNPVIVAVFATEITGWASLNAYSDRLGYADTAEVSLYIAEKFRGQGVGRALLKQLLVQGKEGGLYTVLARITEGNQISIDLHQEFGFVRVGVLRELGIKFGKRIDVHILQLIFKA